MKIVLINTSDRQGGAAVAASRLRAALSQNGIEVKMMVRDKLTGNPDTVPVNEGWFRRKINRFRFLWERFVIWLHNGFTRKDLFAVSIGNSGTDLSQRKEVREADIIHLHWFNQGMLSLRGLQKILALGKPVVWTLHDMWAATGICHHAWECGRYKSECGACPFLHSKRKKDLSTRVFHKKKTLYNIGMPVFVPVSSWLAEKCEESALTKALPVQVIPNAMDTNFFTPGDKTEARKRLGLPSGKKIILMGAARIDDPVKGFPLLLEALGNLPGKSAGECMLVLFGRFKDPEAIKKELPVEVFHLGSLADPSFLVDAYRSADITVSSSHYETFGQTLSEAMACGCPAVGFDHGGQRDVIDHLQNGYLAAYPDTKDLARGIEWVFNYPDPEELSRKARQKTVDRFTTERIAGQYIKLYRSLLEKGKP